MRHLFKPPLHLIAQRILYNKPPLLPYGFAEKAFYYLLHYNTPVKNNQSDKIDFTTLKGSSNIPFAIDEFVMYGMHIRLCRIGNFVFTSGSAVTTSFPAGNQIATSVVCPTGFRPGSDTASGVVFGNCVDGQYSSGEPVILFVHADGSTSRTCSRDITGATRVEYHGSWITFDDFPS